MDTTSPKIDVTNPETAAWLKSKLFQVDDGNDGMGDKNAALNNLRREISQLSGQLEQAQKLTADYPKTVRLHKELIRKLIAERNAARDALTEANQEIEILRGELASAREQLQAVAA